MADRHPDLGDPEQEAIAREQIQRALDQKNQSREMNWDLLNEKLWNKLSASASEEIIKLVKEEFGELSDLAFAFLESRLFDIVKYSSLSHAMGDRKAGHECADGQYLLKKLSDFKKEFKEMVR